MVVGASFCLPASPAKTLDPPLLSPSRDGRKARETFHCANLAAMKSFPLYSLRPSRDGDHFGSQGLHRGGREAEGGTRNDECQHH